MSHLGSLWSDRRWLALGVLCVGMLMIVLDNTVVNVALPSIQSDLGFSQANLAWVVNAYMIAFGGLLLLAGRLGDLIGSKRVFISGLTLFTFASLLCGISWTREVLVAARFLQGLGGALASSVILAMIVTTFSEGRERAKAMGVFSFTASAGGSIGLLLGGTLTQVLSWHWAFLVNVPIGIAAVVLAARLLEGGTGIGLREGADGLGAFLITASLMLAVYTVVEIPAQGAASAHTLIGAAAAIVLFAAFVVRQATAVKPLLPLRLLRSRNVIGTNVLQLLLVAGMYGFFFLDALSLRLVSRYDAVATGLAFLPVTIAIGTLSLGWSARLAARFGARAVVIAGIAFGATALAIFALAPPHSGYVTTVFPAMLLLGVGMGVSFPSLMMFAMAGATQRDAGLTSGLVNTTAQVGGAFGLAILAALSASRTHQVLATGASAPDALGAGYRLAFGAAAGCLIVAAIIAATVLQSHVLDGGETVSHSAAA